MAVFVIIAQPGKRRCPIMGAEVRSHVACPDDGWSPPPAHLDLSDGEVHVWRASLELPRALLRRLELTLSEAERAKAARFFLQRDGERFVVARGLLRRILGRYLNLPPGALHFGYTRHGKPYLANELAEGALRFNLSHSHGLALYAVARGSEVGVDLERIRLELPDEELAERFFAPQERAALRTLAQDLRPRAFFELWTRKEAYLKGIGKGHSLPLDSFTVSLGAPLGSGGALGWTLQALTPGPGYAAALAVAGGEYRLSLWQWPC
jgi:4'-phosphopantetheinyl transferase